MLIDGFEPVRLPAHIYVRADGSSQLGYGHLTRTLSVIKGLNVIAKIPAIYLMNENSDPMPVEDAGYNVRHVYEKEIGSLSQIIRPGRNILIIDSYSLKTEDLAGLQAAGFFTVVFDDGCRLEHYDSQVVIDYSPIAEKYEYRGLPGTRFCLGLEYFPLRDQFADCTEKSKIMNRVHRVVVTFGGSDPVDQTARVVRILAERFNDWEITAVLGPGYHGRAEKMARQYPSIGLVSNISDMAKIMMPADLVVSSAGVTALECAYLGIPLILLELSDDQSANATSLALFGAAANLGRFDHVRDEEIVETVKRVSENMLLRSSMSIAGPKLIAGNGAERLARTILNAWQGRRNDACDARKVIETPN